MGCPADVSAASPHVPCRVVATHSAGLCAATSRPTAAKDAREPEKYGRHPRAGHGWRHGCAYIALSVLATPHARHVTESVCETAMTEHLVTSLAARTVRSASTTSTVGQRATARRHVSWLAAGIVMSFLVPFVLADQLGLQRDPYYGIYIAAVVGLFISWAQDTRQSLRELCARHWRWAAGLGLIVAGLLRPHRAWPGERNVAPRQYRVRRRDRLARHPVRRGRATYHLGYSDFRSSKLRKPVTGDLIWGVPTLATLNPIGAPLAHIGLHVAAVTHSYDTDLFLPPH